MTDMASSMTAGFPESLDAAGPWRFGACYEVHDGWGRIEGAGETIRDAIEHGFEENADGCIGEAWDPDRWELDALAWRGHDIVGVARDAMKTAWKEMEAFSAFDDAPAMRECIGAMQTARTMEAGSQILSSEVIRLLVERNRG